MTLSVRQTLIPLADRVEWEAALQGIPHAFAHTRVSCYAMHLTTGWPTYLYLRDDGASRTVCAIAERGEASHLDVVTPYGFGGFTSTGHAPGLLEDWAHFARGRDYVCGYLGLNPLFASPDCTETADYWRHSEVYVLELDRGIDALFGELSTNRRRQVRAFDDASVRVIDDQERLTAYFLDGIRPFLQASGASSTYAFDLATWRALLESDNVVVLGVEESNTALVAAALFAHSPHCGEYLFGMSCPEGRKYSAALIWSGAARLAGKGVPRLNLGGGVHPGDGIAEFKKRFGGVRLPLGALKQVYRPDVYAALCGSVGKGSDDRSGFFPPYRAPGGIQPRL